MLDKVTLDPVEEKTIVFYAHVWLKRAAAAVARLIPFVYRLT